MADSPAREHYNEALVSREEAARAYDGKDFARAALELQFTRADTHLAEVALLLADGLDPGPWNITDTDDRNTILGALSYIRDHTGGPGERARVTGVLKRLGGEV